MTAEKGMEKGREGGVNEQVMQIEGKEAEQPQDKEFSEEEGEVENQKDVVKVRGLIFFHFWIIFLSR